MIERGGNYYWDIEKIYQDIIDGLKRINKNTDNPLSIGIDTWGVDYVLLDSENNKVSPVYAYRDDRTNETLKLMLKKISKVEIYNKTGIQFLQFNTIFQLYEHVRSHKEAAQKTNVFLMIPDYLNYLLSGVKLTEFTNATTTQLFNIHKQSWDKELINLIGLDLKVFPKVVAPGSVLGHLTKEIQEETNLPNLKVVVPGTHDTASAVVSIPTLTEDFAYISSGTWSLMGIESTTPICTKKALNYNFTNEGGVFNTFRVLKNIMGLWLIQEVKRLLQEEYSFSELVSLAEQSLAFHCLINPNDKRFLNPNNMIDEIKKFCIETNQNIPNTPGEIARCIFESLAFQYKEVLLQINDIQNKIINNIHIIGGGSQNHFLNQLCANFTGCEVIAGPVEATAIGNLIVQYITLGEIESLHKGRQVILNSFDVKKFKPIQQEDIEKNWQTFKLLTKEE